ncbi:hypothetical protein SteCoe_22953 [Stentor coeruleus]|uniref:CMP/dCMP-type deaminase domain-containing protein n=1 Tax=Stentor coeruleus TaxID=5963 RepID=A0A1R2BL24_9CILI|nr:hypothetical protein SteCoe_22953 [Stentor coeruleus]
MNFMQNALDLAKIALDTGEVPVACVIVKDGHIIGEGHNLTTVMKNATKHCEFIAVEDAKTKHPDISFQDAILYVTCEPCIMCAEFLALIGIKKVYFGCYNQKFGGNGSILNLHEGRYESIGGLYQEEAVNLLKIFYGRGNPNAPPHKRHRALEN